MLGEGLSMAMSLDVAVVMCWCPAHLWRDACVQPGLPCTSEHEFRQVAAISRRGASLRHQPWRPPCQKTWVS